MRIWPLGALAVLFSGLLLVGCGSDARPPKAAISSTLVAADPTQAATPAAPPAPAAPAPGSIGDPGALKGDVVIQPADLSLVAPPEPPPQEKYDAALLDAVNLLADRKYSEALASLEAARVIQDTEQVRLEIDKVKKLIEQQAAADQTVLDIQTVLKDGKPDDAVRLAVAGLQQYGGSDLADQLSQLKRQADALVTLQVNDNAARRDRFRQEGDAALKDGNLRAAAIAYEQTLQYGDDDALRRQLDDLRGQLQRYDENRQKAADLRRDPTHLEDAIAALQEAQKAWDTLQVRQDLDTCTLALQKRRDAISVADLEVRGEVGIPEAGKTIAEELLPAFKSRFDLLERGQLGKVVEELKLQQTDLFENESGRREIGRLAKVRYLVLGSVTRISGITVNARLVDVRTGLVVQTAKVVAPTPDELMPLLPQLANLLMMTDEQKIAYEKQLAQQAPPPVVSATPAALPPPPPPPADDHAPPPPVIVNTPVPPPLGGCRPDDFDHLPPPPPAGQAATVVVVEQPHPARERLFALSVELGDNLFRRGRFREAHAHFSLALNLCPDRQDLRVRVDNCQPHLPPPPPPPVVVVVENPPPPPPPPRPRLAVLNFGEFYDPSIIPPGLGVWTADNLAPYFCPPYEVVDRGELFWYMGRLGMTVRDVLTDPWARRWLARAMNVRFFVFGSLRPGNNIDVTTHLVDAEYGCELGGARISVADPIELKLRLPELARLTLMPPEERVVFVRQREASFSLVIEAQKKCDGGELSLSLELFGKAAQAQPDNIQIQVLFQRCRQRAHHADLEAARRRSWEEQQARIVQLQQQQWALAQAAQAARLQAQQEAAALADAQRVIRHQQAELAHAQLMLQAQAAFRVQNFQVSINLYQSALALKQSDEGYRELALARARAQEAAHARAAEAQAAREVELRRQREAEIAQLQAQVVAERQRRQAAEEAARKAQQDRDNGEYTRLLDQGQRQFTQAKYGAAVVSFQTARQLHKTDEVERLLSQAMVEQARAAAQEKGAQARADLEKQLAAEKARREAAEAEAKRNRDLYLAKLQAAQQAHAEKHYEVAIAKYHEADKVFHTDVVLTGLHQAEAARAAEVAQVEAEKRKQLEEQNRGAEVMLRLTEGQKALEAKQYDKAVQAYTAATKLAPNNVDALAGLSKAQHVQAEATAAVKRQKDDQDRQAQFRTLLASGKANLAAKRYEAAAVSLSEAVKLNPADTEAKAALQEAEKAKAAVPADDKAKAEAQKKAEDYQKWMGEGRVALATKQWDAAIKAYGEAQRVMPGDASSAAFLKDAQQHKQDEAAAVAAEARKREDERKRAGEVQKALTAGRTALAAKNLDAAAKAFSSAAQLAPTNAEVIQAQEDLRKAQEAAKAAVDAHQKRRDDFAALVKTGREMLAAKRYDDAVKELGEALRLQPDDHTAQDLLHQAEKARDDARHAGDKARDDAARQAAEAARKKQEEDQRRDQVQKLLASGRAALNAKQWDVASKAFADASKLAPQDPAVTKALQDLDQARTAAAADADKAKRQADYQAAMTNGRTALTAKRYDEAVKAFTDAGRLIPGDKDAAALLQQAEKERNAARAAAAAEQKRRADFNQLMQQGQTAMTAKHYEEAVKAYTEALKVIPGDAEATRALQGANQALDASRTPPKPPQAPQPPQPPAELTRLMQQGQTALTAKRYDEAVTAFTEATKLQPNDAAAAKALREATAARDAARTPPSPPKPPPASAAAEYAKQMQAAAGLEKQQKYADAIAAYKEALKWQPGDAKATAALKNAEFQRHMAEAQKAATAKHFADAVKEYEEALKLFPGNADATAGLKRAHEGKP